MPFDVTAAKLKYAQRPLTFYDPLNLPYEGPVLALKNRDSERNKPQKQFRAQAAMFKTWEPEHLEAYGYIKQWIGRGWGIQGKECRQVLPEQGGWLIFLRWCDCYCRVLSDADYERLQVPNRSSLIPSKDAEERPILDCTLHTQVLNTGNILELERYQDIWQQLMDKPSSVKLVNEDVAYSLKDSAWLILIQWQEYFLRDPGPDGR